MVACTAFLLGTFSRYPRWLRETAQTNTIFTLPDTKRRMTTQIIGAGHHRTSTLSLRNAFEQLGFPCHHTNDIARTYTENDAEASGVTG